MKWPDQRRYPQKTSVSVIKRAVRMQWYFQHENINRHPIKEKRERERER
jgi:hypothetical protein